MRHGDRVNRSSNAVRPVLVGKNFENHFYYGGCSWTKISNSLALADTIFCKMPFQINDKIPHANDYNHSNIKKYLDNWLKSIKQKENK